VTRFALAAAERSFIDEVLLELLIAVGGALFLGNVMALVRRRREGAGGDEGDLDRPPVARTVIYAVIGLVVAIAGLGSLIAGG